MVSEEELIFNEVKDRNKQLMETLKQLKREDRKNQSSPPIEGDIERMLSRQLMTLNEICHDIHTISTIVLIWFILGLLGLLISVITFLNIT